MKSNISDHNQKPDNEQLRLDIWLWTSRFYKTRKMATDAIKGGHISVNGQKGKPGKTVRVNDRLVIKKYQQHYHITIQGLSDKRLGAPLAQQLYVESEESKNRREEQIQMQKQLRQGLRFDPKKPSKRDRQSMLKIKRQPI